MPLNDLEIPHKYRKSTSMIPQNTYRIPQGISRILQYPNFDSIYDFFTGFIPTFGPAFVHLYGSTRDYNLIDEHSNLNDGLGEGVSYRGRLLIALKTDISDSIDTAPSEVEVMPTQTINEVSKYDTQIKILKTSRITRYSKCTYQIFNELEYSAVNYYLAVFDVGIQLSD